MTDARPLPFRAAAALEELDGLDPAIDRARDVISHVPGAVRDVLHGEPLGHPAHPIAVLVPAGAWISAAVLDVLPGQQRAAQTLVGVGVLAAAPAALSGWADWWTLRRRDQQRVGAMHAVANATAVGLYALSWLQRRRGRHVSGAVLGFAGLAVVSASGYLGGHLAYRQGAGVVDDRAGASALS